MVYKCKICGGQATIDQKNGIIICDYCGTKQALPLFTDKSAQQLYERGNAYLSQSEYDKAEAVFNQLLSINPNDPEMYWDLVLCKYGVTYVKDPKTSHYIPTCNRTHYTSIFKDENYQRAIELSTGEKNDLYKADAETIDSIQRGIIAVSKKEKPFDIFISYKETNVDGNRTEDSIVAQNLYEKLTAEGYKVFFSRITLEDKIGIQYEPYIYAALYSSKVMLTICSSKENIDAVWVKNEWSRFLMLRQNDPAKTLIPLYFDMSKSDLPDEFGMLSVHNIKEEGFEQELLRGIKKLIPLPVMLAQKRKKIRKTLGITSIFIAVVAIVITAIFLPGYIKNIKYGEKYAEAIQLFENAQYEEASAIFAELGDYENATEMVDKSEIQPEYNAAEKLYYNGYYAQAAWAFEKLGTYEDSVEMKEKAELSWRKSLATVVVQDIDGYSRAIYYINENGTVDTLEGTGGNAHTKLDIANHGKIISLGMADPLYALHEDGYMSNAKENNNLTDDSEWHNIVKISRLFNNTNIALRADGTMLFSDNNENENDKWLEGLSSWTDIVDFEVWYMDGDGLFENYGVIIGVKSDGTLCAVTLPPKDDDGWGNATNDGEEFEKSGLDSIISQFHDVRKLKFDFDYDYNNSRYTLTIIALTKDNKLITYINGLWGEKDASDVCDIISTDCVLKIDGSVTDVENEKVVLYDVVYGDSTSEKAYAITRTGTIYICNHRILYGEKNTEFEQTVNKTYVNEEWVSRLN